MRPQGRAPRIAAALTIALALGGVSGQVATADDHADLPSRQEVRDARAAVDAQALDVDGIQAALAAARDRLEEAEVAALQAAEAFNGARYEARLARRDARRAAARAVEAAEDAGRQRKAYQDAVVTSYTHGSRLDALSTVAESEGLSELVQRSATMRNSESALDARYDDLLDARSEADEAEDDAEAALGEAEDAADRARDARDSARLASDAAAAVAHDIAAERTGLLARLARLEGISIGLAERRQAGLEARAAEPAADEVPPAPADPQPDPQPAPEPQPESAPDDPEPAPAPLPADPGPTTPPPPSGDARAAIAFARAQLGEPYRWGAAGPGAWDCSGLTMGAWSAGGRSLPHYSVAQYEESTPIAATALRPGDLVFWGSSGSPSSIYHVALYTGGGRIIHAPRTGRPVTEESMHYWRTPDFYARP